MVKPAPPIDSRNAAQIAQQVQQLLQLYVPQWREFEVDPETGDRIPKGISAALIGIFARYCEIIIQRLNQVPDKNLLAFLNLLGASRLPPQPARVPLTFSLAAGSKTDAVVPAGTQVAAPPAEGEQDPIIFETEQELVVVAAELVSLWVRDATTDCYSDRSTILQTADAHGVPAFSGDLFIPHHVYIGHDQLFGLAPMSRLDLTLELEEPNSDCAVAWEIWDAETEQWVLRAPDSAAAIPSSEMADSEAIQNLQQSGTLHFTNLQAIPVTSVNGQVHHWLRCRLTKPITLSPDPDDPQPDPSILVSQLPTIRRIGLQATLAQTKLLAEAAFANQFPVDTSQVFFPFGEKPALGNVFYLAHAEAFSQAGADITLTMTVIEPTSHPPDQPNPELTWEFWNGRSWQLIGKTRRSPASGANREAQWETTDSLTVDSTEAFQKAGTQQVRFRLPVEVDSSPVKPALITINGVENYWIRVRISQGNYGREARYVPTEDVATPVRVEPATFSPPILSELTIAYAVTTPAQPEPPEQVLCYNDFGFTQIAPGAVFQPFQPTPDLWPMPYPRLYLGFRRPADRPTFPNQPLSLYLRTADYGPEDRLPSLTEDRPQLTWQYWQGQTWRRLIVRDRTEHFTRPGLVEFLPPADLTPKAEFGLSDRYWIRVAWEGDDLLRFPRLRYILGNTTLAAQTVTMTNETLGSGNGTERQGFSTVRSPVLAGQQLQVCEPEIPSAQEQAMIKQEEGADAISLPLTDSGRRQRVWVRWHEVPDFYGSGPRDRHYTLNRLTGAIQFGDGLNGLVPPAGSGNVRMVRYQTGGGAMGNRGAHTIVQLKTTVPYIEAVTNPEPASGGADAESLESLLERMPRTIRHRGRAVTLEDYEDLAKLASPDVARAKGVPLQDLSPESRAKPTPNPAPGCLSLIIVPCSQAAKPVPSLALINHVQQYLRTHGSLTAKVAVIAPQYLEVNVTTEVAVTSLTAASQVEQAVAQRLARFLHPLTGGLDGTGWGFGREPYRSDFYRQLESVPGVDHVRSLQVKLTTDPPDQSIAAIQQTGLFLIYSGQHTIQLVFKET